MRNFLGKTVKRLKPNSFLNYFSLSEDSKGAISLGVGEPDFKTPKKVRDAAIKCIKSGQTQYTGCRGLEELRKLVSRYLKERFSVEYPAERIIMTIGASEGITLALRTICGEGDEVLLPEPYYVSYEPAVILAGGKPVPVRCYEKDGFLPTAENLQKAVTERTKALIICYPNNPTGAVMSKEKLEEIAAFAKANDLVVITDEIYAELTYSGKHCSIAALPEMAERTVYVGGFSKSFSMTGWRLGYMCAPAEIDEAALEVHTHTVICASRISQTAAICALEEGFKDGFAYVEKMRNDYCRRGKILADGLNSMGLKCLPPQGAFYVFADVSSTGLDGAQFAANLAKFEKIAVVAGDAFGEAGKNYVRFSYSVSIDNIREALERIKNFLSARPDKKQGD